MPVGAARLWGLAWFASTLAVAAAEILPWSNFQGHSHWAKVCWIPFGDRHLPGFWLDLCQNVVLLLPFGFTGVRAAARPTQIVMLAALLMICGELFQVYCHNRFPSMTDVTAGTAGAWIGVLAGVKWKFERWSG
jgi:glycopeptide antibiotics resistance protein